MKGYIANIEKLTLQNENFRQVLYTAKHAQLVLMALNPGEEIGEEVHEVDQFIRIESGTGKAVLNGVETKVEDGSAIVIPAGVRHNVVNGTAVAMKLYTLYSPPEHKDGVEHNTKAGALEDTDDHFDGQTSE